MYIHSLLMTENKFWLDNNTYINSQKRLTKLLTVLNILVVWNQKQSKTHTSYQFLSLIFSFLQYTLVKNCFVKNGLTDGKIKDLLCRTHKILKIDAKQHVRKFCLLFQNFMFTLLFRPFFELDIQFWFEHVYKNIL